MVPFEFAQCDKWEIVNGKIVKGSLRPDSYRDRSG